MIEAEDRREAERLGKVYAERAMIAHDGHETFTNAGRVAIDAFIAGRESMRAESDAAYTDEHNRAECFRRGCADLRDQLKAERERSARLIERIRKCMKDEEFITKLGCELLSAFIHVYVYGEHDADVAGNPALGAESQ